MYACAPVGDTGFNSSWSRCIVARSFALAVVSMEANFASSKPIRTPVIGDRALGYIVNSSGPMKRKRLLVAMVPKCHNRYTPRAMVPNIASCRIVNTFLVAKYVKSKMTRERDLSQVNFIDQGFESAANLLVKYQFHQRIPHVVCKTFIRTRSGRNTRRWAFHGSLKVQQGTVKGTTGQKAAQVPASIVAKKSRWHRKAGARKAQCLKERKRVLYCEHEDVFGQWCQHRINTRGSM